MEIRTRIVEAYAHHLREHGKPPESVYRFAQSLDLNERDFFEQFASFDAIEGVLWQELVERVANSVSAGPEWASFSARQRLLAFYFGFVEEALNWRSLLLLHLGKIGPLARPAYLRGMESSFKAFASEVLQHGLASGELAPRGRLEATYPEALYVHFRGLIDFNLKDESAGYERTDAFVEKTVNLAFDLLRPHAIDSAFDLIRFLTQRPTPGAGGR